MRFSFWFVFVYTLSLLFAFPLSLTASASASSPVPSPAAAHDTPSNSASSPSVSSLPSASIPEYLSWAESKGIFLSPLVELTESPATGRGLFARSNIVKGARVVGVPLTSIVTVESVLSSASVGSLVSALGETESMATFIALCRNRAQKKISAISPEDPCGWTAFWGFMQHPDTPMFYDADSLAELKHSAVDFYAMRRNAHAETKYEKLPKAIKDSITAEEFKIGLSILWSRTFGLKVKDPKAPEDAKEADKWVKLGALVPMADLLNAGSEAEQNVDCLTNKLSTYFECFTRRDIPAGSELLAPYGTGLHNAQLLNDYGFAFEQNDNDLVEIRFPLVASRSGKVDQLFERQLALLTAMEKYEQARFHIKYPKSNTGYVHEALPNDLWAYARVAVMDDADLKQLETREMFTRLKKGDSFNDENDLRATKYLIEQLSNWLDQYPTTIDYDELLLKMPQGQAQTGGSNTISRRMRAILLVRIGEKRILHRVMEILWQYRLALESDLLNKQLGQAAPVEERLVNEQKLGMRHNTPYWEDFQDEYTGARDL